MGQLLAQRGFLVHRNILLSAFGLTALAGLATGIGSLIALLAKRPDRRFLSASLGLSEV